MILPNLIFLKKLTDLTPDVWKANFDTITKWWNDHDSGIRSWTKISGPMVGVTNGSSAAAGNVGEYVESIFANVPYGASGVFNDATSISLTAGDWDVTLNLLAAAGATTNCAATSAGISVTPGNFVTGLVLGSSYAGVVIPYTPAYNTQIDLVNLRYSLSSTTIIYAKQQSIYTSSIPSSFGRLSARRIR